MSELAGVCAECGAARSESGSCRAYLDEALLVEWSIPGGPGYRAHFLAVATFNLQHPAAFVPEVLSEFRQVHSDVLHRRKEIAAVLSQIQRLANGPQRVLQGELAGVGVSREHLDPRWPTSWPMTVLDVCRVEPGEYVDRVEEWASGAAVAVDSALFETGETKGRGQRSSPNYHPQGR